ncbi:MAG: uracil-DNA glycosylase [Abditibacteriota bacterium]|nr:uracil-DNA glycosylase [Abditibacteriota bacterium]
MSKKIPKECMDGIQPKWKEFFEDCEITDDLFKILNSGNIKPTKENVFNAFKHADIKDIKCVILGQDPYPDPTPATGLAFSLPREEPIPNNNSLKYIFAELELEKYSIPNNGDLTPWAERGVLLLNSALTYCKSEQDKHLKLWRPFTVAVLRKIITEGKNHVVFMLWGDKAQETFFKNALKIKPNLKKGYHIVNTSVIISDNTGEKKHLVLMTGHPSPRSKKYFHKCYHFRLCNEFLKEHYKDSKDQYIEWEITDK